MPFQGGSPLQHAVLKIYALQQTPFLPNLREGVMPHPKFCMPIVLLKGSAQAKKTEKIMHTVLHQACKFFQIWGPCLQIGADIRMLSQPSARWRYMLKILSTSKAKFGTGTLRGSVAAGNNLHIFWKNGSHVWGLALSPLCILHSGRLLIRRRRHFST